MKKQNRNQILFYRFFMTLKRRDTKVLKGRAQGPLHKKFLKLYLNEGNIYIQSSGITQNLV